MLVNIPGTISPSGEWCPEEEQDKVVEKIKRTGKTPTGKWDKVDGVYLVEVGMPYIQTESRIDSDYFTWHKGFRNLETIRIPMQKLEIPAEYRQYLCPASKASSESSGG